MKTTENKKEYNLTLAPMYEIANGLWSIPIQPNNYDAFQKVEVGGRVVLKFLKPESRKSDKTPHAFLEYMTPAEVEAFNARKRPQTDDEI